MIIGKTQAMREKERELGAPLEDYLPELVREVGLRAAANQMGVSQDRLGYWLIRLGYNVRRGDLND